MLENIESYWKDVHEVTIENATGAAISAEASVNAQTPGLLAKVFSIVASVRSDLRIQSDKREILRKNLEPRLNIFIGLVNDFIESVRVAGKKKGFRDAPPVVLLNDLEKANMELTADLFEKHSQDLVLLRSHIVLPFPVEMCYMPGYNQIKNYYREEWILPMIKLRIWDNQTQEYTPFDTGKEVLRKIIFRRMDEKLFADGVLDYMIEKTGGFLRDLFTVIYDAVLNALARESPDGIVEEQDMQVALDKLQAGVSRRFPDSGRARLERIKNGEKRYAFDEELMVFLRSGAVFEYNGKRWVDLHPLVLDWLNETRAPES